MSGEIECAHCFDTGVCFLELFEGRIEMLMRCGCKRGEPQDYRLPRWELKVGQIASRKAFPADWFKPKPGESLWGKADQWKAKIDVAEEFWKEQGSSET